MTEDFSQKANTDVSKLELKYQFAFIEFSQTINKCSREQAIELAKQIYKLHLNYKNTVEEVMKLRLD